MSSLRASRQARSCGESTSTPSTSKMAPRKPVAIAPPLLLTDARRLRERECVMVAGAQLANVVAHRDPDRPAESLGVHDDGQPAVLERDPDRRPPELHREREPVEAVGEPWVEVQDAVADVGADVSALDEIERPRHHSEVDALLGGAALDVSDVALERLDEALPGAL